MRLPPQILFESGNYLAQLAAGEGYPGRLLYGLIYHIGNIALAKER